MARTVLNAVKADGSQVVSCVVVSYTAADVANGNATASTGKEILVARNADAVNPHLFTMYSVNGSFQYSVPASGEIRLLQIPLSGWKQADGNLWFNGDNSNIQFAILQTN